MNQLKVKGFSTINHYIANKLCLVPMEYMIIDFIANWNDKNLNSISYKDYYEHFGISPFHVDVFLKILKASEFLIWDHKKNRVDISDKWKSEFNFEGKINDLWEIHPAGTKAKAKNRLNSVLKQISFNDLKDKLIKYVKDCKDKDSFPKNLDTWLNPKDKHWESIVIDRKKTIKKEVKTSVKFMK